MQNPVIALIALADAALVSIFDFEREWHALTGWYYRGRGSVVSVVDSERRAYVQRRSIPLGTRFSPQFLAELRAAVRRPDGKQAHGMAGLLFGKTERNVVNLEAFLAVPPDCVADAQSRGREPLERALDRMLAKSTLQREFAGLELAGWCCVQSSDELSDLPPGCLEFHRRRFRRASDVLLIMRGDAGRELFGQMYGRASDLPLSLEHHVSGSIMVDTERPASRPVTVSISAKAEPLNPELYLRTYESARELERAEKREARREAFRRMIDWRMPRWATNLKSADEVRITPAAAPEVAVVRAAPLELGLKPARGGRRVWILTLALLLVAAGLAVAFFNLEPEHYARILAAPQNGGLGLRIEAQTDAFLVSWDREAPAVRAASKGILRIQDGQERRSTELAAAELANGSILYRPRSDDVDFLLTVYEADGSVAREGVRAVDGASGPKPDAAAPQLAPTALRHRETEIRSMPAPAAEPANVSTAHNVQQSPVRFNSLTNQTAPNQAAANREARDYVEPKPLRVVMPDLARLDAARLPPAGKIVVEVQIDTQGRVTGAHIPAGAPRLSHEAAQAALAAAQQWRFEPATLGGNSIPSRRRLVFDIHAGQ
jgi:TonB family protein